MITIDSANKLKKHITDHIPGGKDLKVASVYNLGWNLEGDGIGHIISSFVTGCWDSGLVPILAVENTKIGSGVFNALADDLSIACRTYGYKTYGLYWANVKDIATRERIITHLPKIHDMYIINTEIRRDIEGSITEEEIAS